MGSIELVEQNAVLIQFIAKVETQQNKIVKKENLQTTLETNNVAIIQREYKVVSKAGKTEKASQAKRNTN